jgi:hypothetical protein
MTLGPAKHEKVARLGRISNVCGLREHEVRRKPQVSKRGKRSCVSCYIGDKMKEIVDIEEKVRRLQELETTQVQEKKTRRPIRLRMIAFALLIIISVLQISYVSIRYQLLWREMRILREDMREMAAIIREQ